MQKPDEVRTIRFGAYRGCDLEFYAESARSRTVLCGGGMRPWRITTPDLYVMRMRLDGMRIDGRGPSDSVGLVCRDGKNLYASCVVHADVYGFMCVGGAANRVTRGEIPPSDAVWMTTFADADDGCVVEYGIRTVRNMYAGIDGLVGALQAISPLR